MPPTPLPNRETLRLYRDILRVCRGFTWCDKEGRPWSVVLKKNARKEIEEAKYEKDPLLIARMLVVGRDCLDKTTIGLSQAAQDFKNNVDRTRTS